MKVLKSELITGLELMNIVVEKRKYMPILANTLFEIEHERLTLSGTDLETSITHEIDVRYEDEEKFSSVSFTANTASLLKVLKTYPDGYINIDPYTKAPEEEKDSDQIEASEKVDSVAGITIFEADGCELSAETLSPEEYPKIINNAFNGIECKEVDILTWMDITSKLLPAISKDTDRVNLYGAFVHNHNGGSRLVGTDGYKMVVLDSENIGADEVTIPRDGLVKLQKVLKKLKPITETILSGVQVEEKKSNISGEISKEKINFAIGTRKTNLYMRLIEEEYPNYKQVIPENNTINFSVDRVKLVNSMKRLIAISTDKYKGFKLSHDGEGSLIMEANGDTSFKQLIDMQFNELPCDFFIGLTSQYVLDYCNVIKSDNVHFSLKDEVSRCLLTCDENLTGIIMPMKLK
jgi:DNA polymerase-3 subunit beta